MAGPLSARLAPARGWLRAHRVEARIGAAMLACLLIVAAGLLLQRQHQVATLAALLDRQNIVLRQALDSPALFSGAPSDAAAQLALQAAELADLRRQVQGARSSLAHSPRAAADLYSDYLARIGASLSNVGQSAQAAEARRADYRDAVRALMSSNWSTRVAAQQRVDRAAADARNAADLALAECDLLTGLLDGYAVTRSRALQGMDSGHLLDSAALLPLREPLQNATVQRRAARHL